MNNPQYSGVRRWARRALSHGRSMMSTRPPSPAISDVTPLPRKLNVGCGYDKRPDYLNIDVDPACEPDVLIVDNDFSPIPTGYFDEVLAKDVL